MHFSRRPQNRLKFFCCCDAVFLQGLNIGQTPKVQKVHPDVRRWCYQGLVVIAEVVKRRWRLVLAIISLIVSASSIAILTTLQVCTQARSSSRKSSATLLLVMSWQLTDFYRISSTESRWTFLTYNGTGSKPRAACTVRAFRRVWQLAITMISCSISLHLSLAGTNSTVGPTPISTLFSWSLTEIWRP